MDVNLYTDALREFQKLDPEMQIPAMYTFLYVALNGPCNQRAVEEAVGISGASASRNISYWCVIRKRGVPGLGMLERYEDPDDRRNNVIRLTPKGKRFLEKLRGN